MCYNVMHVYRACIKRPPKTEYNSSKALICVAKLVKKCLAVALLLIPNLKDYHILSEFLAYLLRIFADCCRVLLRM